MPFVLRKGEQSKEFKVVLSKEDYNKFTDFSILIYDTEGIAVNKNGLSFREGSVDVENSSDADSTEFIFEIVPAFTNETDEAAVELTITTEFFTEHQIGVIHNKKPMITLYPSLPKTLDLYIEKPNEFFPENSTPIGKIYFEASSTEKTEYELPINFNF
jgi:hypothetical protein